MKAKAKAKGKESKAAWESQGEFSGSRRRASQLSHARATYAADKYFALI